MAQQNREWFFLPTGSSIVKGSRFLTNNKPTESTFRDLLDSVLFKTSSGDKATSTTPGHVTLASEADLENNSATDVVTPSQLPSVSAASSDYDNQAMQSITVSVSATQGVKTYALRVSDAFYNFVKGAGVALATFQQVISRSETVSASPENLPVVEVAIWSSSDSVDNTFDGTTIDVTPTAPTNGNPFTTYSLKLSADFRNWLKARLDERPIVEASAVAVAYVLYDSAKANSVDMSVAVKGDGSILKPFCSLHYALTQLGGLTKLNGTTVAVNFGIQKSIIVLDSGQKETLPVATYTWKKSITLNEGVHIVSTDGSSGNDLGAITPLTYLFNATDGFSLNGSGTIGLWNKGLVSIADDYTSRWSVKGLSILYNQIPFNKTSGSIAYLYDNNFLYAKSASTADTENIIRGSIPHVASAVTGICNLTVTGNNYARLTISNCYLVGTLLDVSTSAGYGSIRDSRFYSIVGGTYSYITFRTIASAEYNFTSRNNTFDLLNNPLKTAFNTISSNSKNGVSINDRIVRIASGAADMTGIAGSLYCYNLATSTTLHSSVPDTGPGGSTFIQTLPGITIE